MSKLIRTVAKARRKVENAELIRQKCDGSAAQQRRPGRGIDYGCLIRVARAKCLGEIAFELSGNQKKTAGLESKGEREAEE